MHCTMRKVQLLFTIFVNLTVYFKLTNSQVADVFKIRNQFKPFSQNLSLVEPHSSNFRVITTNFLGVYSYLSDGNFKTLGKGFLQNLVTLVPFAHDTVEHINYNCLNDTEKLILDITQKKLYALQFLNADGKLPPGVHQGARNWVGDYQECSDIKSDFNEIMAHRFTGKYFTVAVSGIFIGICLPDSCDKNDASSLADVVLTSLGGSHLSVAYVIGDNDSDFDGTAIAPFVIAGIVGLLVILGTFTDLSAQVLTGKTTFINGNLNGGLLHDEPTENTGLLSSGIVIQNIHVTAKIDRMKDFLMCFSFLKNVKKLLNTSTATGPLACLNGLRVISMFWVIQGHTYSFSMQTTNNPVYSYTVVKRFTFQAIANGTFSVDTFFFLSGLLVAYLTLKELNQKGKMNWWYYLFHRYWRITPLYAFLILECIVVFTYIPAGPFRWLFSPPEGFIHHSVQSCHSYWWASLLYINNFYPNYGDTSECFSWAWYLANDMQFYIFISPSLILLYRCRKKVGIFAAVGLIVSCVAVRAALVSWYGLHGFGTPTKHKDDPWGEHGALYVRPWARMSTYVVGILTGFVLQHKNCRVKLGSVTVLIGWCIAAGSALAVIYGLYYYNRNGTSMSLLASGFYVALSRTVWSLSLSWLVIACASGYGGPANFVLSWKLWAPLGRLTFAAYLVHPIVLISYQALIMFPIHFTDVTLIYMFISNLVFSYLFAFLLSMTVEAPMLGIEKLLKGR